MNFLHRNRIVVPQVDPETEFRVAEGKALFDEVSRSCHTLKGVLSVLGTRRTLTQEVDALGVVTINHVNEQAVGVVVRKGSLRQIVQATDFPDGNSQLVLEEIDQGRTPVVDRFVLAPSRQLFVERDRVAVTDQLVIRERAARAREMCERLGAWAVDCSQPATMG